MRKYIKMGFGLTMGHFLCKFVGALASDVIGHYLAKDEEFMKKFKEKDPMGYAKFKSRHS